MLKPTEGAWVRLKNSTRNFQNNLPLERLACFQYSKFETNFLKNKNFFSKNWITFFKLRLRRLKTQQQNKTN